MKKHNTVHPEPKQVAWLNLPVGGGWGHKSVSLQTCGNKLRMRAHRLEICGYGLLTHRHDLLDRWNGLRICEYGL